MSTHTLKFLIVDGYPKPSRDQFDQVGMKKASDLYRDMLLTYVPQAEARILFPSDPETVMPNDQELAEYRGVLWTGSNQTIYHHDDPSVQAQIALAQQSYRLGIPAFGSCWALQMAAVAAGGKVGPNTRNGREMGIGRKISLTPEGEKHPMFEGKPRVYDAFVSHEDIVIKVPRGGTVLATNAFAGVQALEVKHLNGVFWAVQYHPEYDLREMSRLLIARDQRLTRQKFFRKVEEVHNLAKEWETLALHPMRKDLRWKYGIDDDVLSPLIRQVEFVNWLKYLVKIPVNKAEQN